MAFSCAPGVDSGFWCVRPLLKPSLTRSARQHVVLTIGSSALTMLQLTLNDTRFVAHRRIGLEDLGPWNWVHKVGLAVGSGLSSGVRPALVVS